MRIHSGLYQKYKKEGFATLEDLKKQDSKTYNAILVDKTFDKCFESCSGWENFPLLCLKLAIHFPYVFDCMKHDILKWELHYYQEKKIKSMKDRYLGTYAGMVG